MIDNAACILDQPIRKKVTGSQDNRKGAGDRNKKIALSCGRRHRADVDGDHADQNIRRHNVVVLSGMMAHHLKRWPSISPALDHPYIGINMTSVLPMLA